MYVYEYTYTYTHIFIIAIVKTEAWLSFEKPPHIFFWFISLPFFVFFLISSINTCAYN